MPGPPLDFIWIELSAHAATDALRHRDAQAAAAELATLARDAGRLAELIRGRVADDHQPAALTDYDLAGLAGLARRC